MLRCQPGELQPSLRCGSICGMTTTRLTKTTRRVDHYDATPLYIQAAQILREQIYSGQLAWHTRLPSEADLDAHFAVARGTVRRSMKLLEEEGLIRTLPARGRIVVWQRV